MGMQLDSDILGDSKGKNFSNIGKGHRFLTTDLRH